MSRPRRHFPGGMVFHVLNRGVGRRLLFTKDEDFLAFAPDLVAVTFAFPRAERASGIDSSADWRKSPFRFPTFFTYPVYPPIPASFSAVIPISRAIFRNKTGEMSRP